jgi:hypothetical protein
VGERIEIVEHARWGCCGGQLELPRRANPACRHPTLELRSYPEDLRRLAQDQATRIGPAWLRTPIPSYTHTQGYGRIAVTTRTAYQRHWEATVREAGRNIEMWVVCSLGSRTATEGALCTVTVQSRRSATVRCLRRAMHLTRPLWAAACRLGAIAAIERGAATTRAQGSAGGCSGRLRPWGLLVVPSCELDVVHTH